MLQLSRQNALEFFEVYRGVVPEYLGWVEEVSCGKCVVLQCVYRDDPASSVEALRGQAMELVQRLVAHSSDEEGQEGEGEERESQRGEGKRRERGRGEGRRGGEAGGREGR